MNNPFHGLFCIPEYDLKLGHAYFIPHPCPFIMHDQSFTWKCRWYPEVVKLSYLYTVRTSYFS